MATVVERRIPFEGIQNFRDLGGYPTAGGGEVRWGQVYRADALHKLTRADIDAFGRLGVRTVYDLRGDVERTEFPGPFDSIHLSIVGRPADVELPPPPPDMTMADGERLLRDLYVGALIHSAAKFGELLTGLADPDRLPAVFHCHGGKDRTGVVAALLLLSLGVDRETVLDDYVATRRYRTIVHQQDSLANMLAAGVAPEAAAGVLGVPRWAMAEAIDAVDRDHGGIDAYLTQRAGLSPDVLQRLRAIHVVPAGAPRGSGLAMTVRVAVVSDTHLSPAAPEADANWDAVLRYVAATEPEVVVHAGDLSLDGANRVEDLRHSRRQLDRLDAAWYAVPGNHDIGDNPRADAPTDVAISTARHERWLEVVGPDHWALDMDGWTLLAINAQLLDSGLDAEEEQWAWLEGCLSERLDDEATVLILHKPLVAAGDEMAAAPPYRFVPPPARHRLLALLAGRTVELVVSGHVHQYRQLDLVGTRHVWAPTTWAVLPEEMQPTFGAKRCGVVVLELGENGRFDAQLVEPAGLGQFTLLHDIPNPYQH